jgi:hypothetical protein
MCLWTIFRITFSNNLSVVDKRLIGRKCYGNFGFFPVFSNVITFASFQGFGKWDSRRQWLNKGSSWKMPKAFVWNIIKSIGLPQF